MNTTGNKRTSAKKGEKKQLTKEERARKQRNRIILISVEVFVLLLMLIALYVVSLYSKIDREEISEDDIVINEGIQEEINTDDNEDKPNVDMSQVEQNEGLGGHMAGYRNIALFGVDARDKSLGKGNRSDTIIVASINEKTKDVKLVSVYRDTYLNQGNDSYDKATHAYAKGGPLQSINMLNQNLDLNITDYMTVGWAGVADTIDALGGIEIDVQKEEISHLNNYQVETSKSLGKNYKKVTQTGPQILDGIQAVSYCRIRYTAGDDFKRTERQRTVIQAILKKAKNANVATLNKAANTIFEEISTSLSAKEMLDLIADVANYNISETGGFPNEEYRTTGNVRGASCVMTTDMVADVTKLHEFLFGDLQGYTPSKTVQTIGAKIHNDTGK